MTNNKMLVTIAALLASVGFSSAAHAVDDGAVDHRGQVKCGVADASGFVPKCPSQGLVDRIQLPPSQGAANILSPQVVQNGYFICTNLASGVINRECLSSYFARAQLALAAEDAVQKCRDRSVKQEKHGCSK